MGLFDFFKKKAPKPDPISSFQAVLNNPSKSLEERKPSIPSDKMHIIEKTNYGAPIHHIEPKGLSTVEKETIMVERVTTEDMKQFSAIPYDLNEPIKKYIQEGAHPFAYIDLNRENQRIAKSHIRHLGEIINRHRSKIPLLAENVYIDENQIAFSQYSDSYGYTRLMCTPYTFAGNISKNPLTLNFMSRLDVNSSITLGEILYGADGKIQKARVNIWEKHITGWGFYFTSANDILILEQVQTTLRPDEYGGMTAVYKDKTLIEYEKERDNDRQDFQWLQQQLPALCPKSLSGFRKMKSSNSKNYQKLVQAAAEKGKSLD